MQSDQFVKIVMAEILKSPDAKKEDNSFFRSSIRAIGRKFESRSIDVPGALAEIERLLPWQLSRDIKKGIDKTLR
ncbi:MAG: hypothetical protein IPJ68_02505 [Candidatus Moraniibacteriota bacterium]|nr:MAG: hypothetical protein IPJ68_02505 [Candidatus Moranbacteria bacterium]